MAEQRPQYDPDDEALQDLARIRSLQDLLHTYISLAGTVPVRNTRTNEHHPVPIWDRIVYDNLSPAAYARLREYEYLAETAVYINTPQDRMDQLERALETAMWLLPAQASGRIMPMLREYNVVQVCDGCGTDLLPSEQTDVCRTCGAPAWKDTHPDD